MTGLVGRRVMVVGASSGLGEAAALACLEQGARVAGLDITPGRPASPDHKAWQVDVAVEGEVAAATAEAVAWLGGLDAVLHVAGIVGSSAPVDELPLADWSRVIAVNLTGPFLVAKHALPALALTGGTLVLVGSGAGVYNPASSVAYAASKAGLHGLALTLEETWREAGVNVVALLPTSIDTPLARDVSLTQEGFDLLRARHRILTADEAAAALAFLASPEGQVVRGAMRTW